MVTLVSKMHVMSSNSFTFHVAFSLENDERIASTAPFFVANYSHPFNTSKTFEFPAEIILCCTLVLSRC